MVLGHVKSLLLLGRIGYKVTVPQPYGADVENRSECDREGMKCPKGPPEFTHDRHIQHPKHDHRSECDEEVHAGPPFFGSYFSILFAMCTDPLNRFFDVLEAMVNKLVRKVENPRSSATCGHGKLDDGPTFIRL